MIYKCVFLDIDGTILKPDHTYSPATKDAINQLQKQDIEVFFATGRPSHELFEFAKELNVKSMIGYNGAYAMHQDQMVVNKPFDRNVIQDFIKVSKEHQQEIVFYTKDMSYFTSLTHSKVKSFIDLFGLKNVATFTNDVQDDILGITIMNLEPDEVSLYEDSGKIHLSQVNIEGFKDCYDLIRNDVNKGMAIQNIFNVLNVTKEQAIAFGDGMNDKEMLTVVGEGFAMGNANQNLLPYAKHQTTSVSDDGIYHGLQKLGLVT